MQEKTFIEMLRRNNKSSKQLLSEGSSDGHDGATDVLVGPSTRLISSPSVVLTASTSTEKPSYGISNSASMMSLSRIAENGLPVSSGSSQASSSSASRWKRWFGDRSSSNADTNSLAPPTVPPKDKRGLLSRKSKESLRSVSGADGSTYSTSPDSETLSPPLSARPTPTLKSSSSSNRLFSRKSPVTKDLISLPLPMPLVPSPLRSNMSPATTPEPFTPQDPNLPLPRHSSEASRSATLASASRKPWSKSVDDLSRILAGVTRSKSRETDDPIEQIAFPSAGEQNLYPSTSRFLPRLTRDTPDNTENLSPSIQSQPFLRFPPPGRAARRKTNSISGTMLLNLSREPVGTVPLKQDLDDKVQGASASLTASSSSSRLQKLSSPPAMTHQDVITPATPRSGCDNEHGKPNAPQGRAGSKTSTFSNHQRSNSSQSLPTKTKQEDIPEMSPKSTRRASQIVYKQGFLLHYAKRSASNAPSPSTPVTSRNTPAEDYFGPRTDKNWKPYKVILRGNKLLFYKPPSDKKQAITSLFPTQVITPASSSAIQETPEKGKKKRITRAYWGTAKHPALEVKEAVNTEGNVWFSKIIAATPDALAHEMIFTTLTSNLVEEADDLDAAAYSDFAAAAMLACAFAGKFDQLLKQLTICIERANNLLTQTKPLDKRVSTITDLLGSFGRFCTDGSAMSTEAFAEFCETVKWQPNPHIAFQQGAPIVDIRKDALGIANSIYEYHCRLHLEDVPDGKSWLSRLVWRDIFSDGRNLERWLRVGEMAKKLGDCPTIAAIAYAVLHPAVVRVPVWWTPRCVSGAQALLDVFEVDTNQPFTIQSASCGIPYPGSIARPLSEQEDSKLDLSALWQILLGYKPCLAKHISVPAGSRREDLKSLDAYNEAWAVSRSFEIVSKNVLKSWSQEWIDAKIQPASISPLLFALHRLPHWQALSSSIKLGKSPFAMMEIFRSEVSFGASTSSTAPIKKRRLSMPSSRRFNAAMLPVDGPYKIFGRILSNEIDLSDLKIVLEISDTGSRPVSLVGSSLSRSASITSKRKSIGSVNAGLLEPLKVQVKSATTDRLVDLLISGVRGSARSVDADGMELGGETSRPFSLDLDSYRRLFLGTYQTCMDASTLFGLLRKRWADAASFADGDDDPQTASIHALLLPADSSNATESITQTGRLVRSAIVDVLEDWSPGLVTELQNDDELRKVVSEFCCLNRDDARLQRWSRDFEKALRTPTELVASTPNISTLDFGITGKPNELAARLNDVGIELSRSLSRQSLWQAVFLFDAQLVDPLGFHPNQHTSRSSQTIATPYSHFAQILGLNNRQSFEDLLPPAIRQYIKSYNVLAKWLAYETFVKPQRLPNRVSGVCRIIGALANVKASQTINAGADLRNCPSFVATILQDVLISSESRQSPEVWQEVTRRLGIVDVSTDSLLGAMKAEEVGFAVVSDLGTMLLRIAEVVWALPNSVNGQVNMNKRSILRELIATADVPDVTSSVMSPNLTNAIQRLTSDISQLSAEAIRLHDRRSRSTLFLETVRADQERRLRDKIARDALMREWEANRDLKSRKSSNFDPALKPATQIKSASGKGVQQRVAGALRTLHLRHSSSFLNAEGRASTTGILSMAEKLRQLEFPVEREPAMAIDLIGSQATKQSNTGRSFTWSVTTELGAFIMLQSFGEHDLEAWLLAANKSSEEGIAQRRTYVPAGPIPEGIEQFAPLSRNHKSQNAVFGVPLSSLMRRQRENSGLKALNVPLIADVCMNEIERRALHEKGIYRVSGSKSREIQLQSCFDDGLLPDISDEGPYADPHIITSTLKTWLRSLPEPVVEPTFFSALMKATQIPEYENRLYAIRAILWLLPSDNFALLERIARHLDLVTYWEADNHMSPQNLALVFAPNLLRPSAAEGGENAMMIYLGHATKFVQILITSHSWLFTDLRSPDASGGTFHLRSNTPEPLSDNTV